MYLHHVTITTGHTRRSQRREVSDDALAAVSAWLQRALRQQKPAPLMPPFEAYAGQGRAVDGALVATLFGRTPDVGSRLPIVSFAVATRSRHGRDLWDDMLKGAPGTLQHLMRPPAPWCAVTVYPTAASDPEALSWAGDFETVVAWAWVTRNPSLRSVP